MNENRALEALAQETGIRDPGPLAQDRRLSVEDACDRLAALLQEGDEEEVSDGLDSLSAILRWRRRQAGPEAWEGLRATVRSHALMCLMLQDPYCRASLVSRRGLTSDPDLLDLVYGVATCSRVVEAASPIGRRIYLHHLAAQHSRALRQQRIQIAEVILATLKKHRSARIAVIDCGRLRELNQMGWSSLFPVDRFLTVDEDVSTVSWIRRRNFHPRLRAHRARLTAAWRQSLQACASSLACSDPP